MYPKVGQNIEILIKEHDHSCRSIIAEIGEHDILIAVPLNRNFIGMLTKGAEIDVLFLSEENQYKFKTEIIAKTKDEKIPLYRLIKPEQNDIVRIQRRENFRVNSHLRLVVDQKELTTINISAGGLLYSNGIDHDLKIGDEISGTLYIPNLQNKENEPIAFSGIIRRVSLIEKQQRTNIAVEFTQLMYRDQRKVIQHCFEKQRQMRLVEKGKRR
ncbi:flagellar brake protein [Bacillus xiapuensis]|uniref:Flagellar brake domain-containing protein n=1 Tax=Bacillus xiapuensis TaxID=2014075 RepID=A0ABU6NB79_9BACI|nr:flagellar brake domain-containing protein [Bacillus xiapuensis]